MRVKCTLFIILCLDFSLYICAMKKSDEGIYCQELRLAVEQRFGRAVVVSSDFVKLATAISESTGMYLSPITLRRFWSDKQCLCYNVSPRRSTLNILSQYVGYGSWDTFIVNFNTPEPNSSGYILKADLPATDLSVGSVLELTWAPDRVLLIISLGDCMFRVLKSKNSKLSVDDTFRVGVFVEGEPLMLTELVHEKLPPVKYKCGKVDGIRYRIVEE